MAIQMARATWDSGWFQAEVYRLLLEDLGYTVDRPVTLDNPTFYDAVSRGSVDLWANGWFPLHTSYESRFDDGAEVIGHVGKDMAKQGYLVDLETARRLDISTLSDFKRPEVKDAFDRDDDGKAEMVACPPGWGCETTIDHHMDAYDLNGHIDPVKASYAASMADTVERHDNGESVFFYTWTPNWTVGRLEPGQEVGWVGVEETRLPDTTDEVDTTAERAAGCLSEDCNLGFVTNDVRPVANSSFLDANPEVARLLEAVRLPEAAIREQNRKMNAGEDTRADIVRHATQWISDNQPQVDEWLAAARDPSVTANQFPRALDDFASGAADEAVSIDVLGNDVDVNGHSLRIDRVAGADHGTVRLADGAVVYTPESGFTGTDTFTYTVRDGHGGTDSARVNIGIASADAVDDATDGDSGGSGGADGGSDRGPENTTPDAPASPAAAVFLNEGRSFTVVEPATVFGASGGDEHVKLTGASAGVRLDANIETLDVPRPLDELAFATGDRGLELRADGTTVVSMPSLNQAMQLRFAGGDAALTQVGATTFEVAGDAGGTATVDAQTDGPIDVTLGDDAAPQPGLTGVASEGGDALA